MQVDQKITSGHGQAVQADPYDELSHNSNTLRSPEARAKYLGMIDGEDTNDKNTFSTFRALKQSVGLPRWPIPLASGIAALMKLIPFSLREEIFGDDIEDNEGGPIRWSTFLKLFFGLFHVAILKGLQTLLTWPKSTQTKIPKNRKEGDGASSDNP